MHCQAPGQYLIIYSLVIVKHYGISLNMLFVPVSSIMSKYCTSPTFLLWFAPSIQQTVKHLGTWKQVWHFYPEGLLTLNISTDRCRFLMPSNQVEGCSPTSLQAKAVARKSTLVHMQVTRTRSNQLWIKTRSSWYADQSNWDQTYHRTVSMS